MVLIVAAISFTSNDTRAEEFVYARDINAIINLDAYEDIFSWKSLQGFLKRFLYALTQVGVFLLGTDIMDHPGRI